MILIRGDRRGISLIEILVSCSIVTLLVALLVPSLSKMRLIGARRSSEENVRQISVAIIAYGVSFKDLPPVLWEPIECYPPADPFQKRTINGIEIRGAWFYQGRGQYHLLLSPLLPARTLWAPGAPPNHEYAVGPESSTGVTDYSLSDCFYAEPAYWDRFTQQGPAQWSPQRLSDVRFPGQKGMLSQSHVYGVPGHPYREDSLIAGVLSSVGWADGSAGTFELSTMPEGEPNFFYHSPPARSYMDSGRPVESTLHGIHGRDR